MEENLMKYARSIYAYVKKAEKIGRVGRERCQQAEKA